MAEKRSHHRVNCTSRCFVYFADSHYSGVLVNISLAGAMVTLHDIPTNPLQPGDRCSLTLCNDPVKCVYQYSGKVAHVTSSTVGLELIRHEL